MKQVLFFSCDTVAKSVLLYNECDLQYFFLSQAHGLYHMYVSLLDSNIFLPRVTIHAVLCLVASVMSDTFVTPWTITQQVPLSMGILQARILEWVVMPYSRGSSKPRDQTQVSRIIGKFFTV